MRKKIILSLGAAAMVLMFGPSEVDAQELESFYQNYFVHPIQMNVARAGLNGHELVLDYHRSFAGFDNTPRVASILYGGSVGENIGIGAQLSSHRAGYQNVFRGGLSYAYKFEFEEVRVQLGLGTNYMSRNLASEALNNSAIDQDDPVLAELADGVEYLDISIGGHVDYKDWEFGLSLPNAFTTRLDREIEVEGGRDENSFNLTVAYVGYDWDFPEQNFSLKPSIYLISGKNFLTEVEGTTRTAVDFNCLLSMSDDKLMGGVSQRFAGPNSATTILVGTTVNAVSFFYTYGIGYSQFQRYSAGSHELSCKIQLK